MTASRNIIALLFVSVFTVLTAACAQKSFFTSSADTAALSAVSEYDKQSIVVSKLRVVMYTDIVKRGETATLTVCGKPETVYDIGVFYSSGESKADALCDKKSDKNGYVTWNWKVAKSAHEYKDGRVILRDGDGVVLYAKFCVV